MFTKKTCIFSGRSIMLVAIALIVGFFSCSSGKNGQPTGKVQFQFSNKAFVANAQTKSVATNPLRNIAPTPAPYSILISLTNTAGDVIQDSKKLFLYNLAGGYISDPLQLPPGGYKLTMFLVLDASNTVIYAAPLAGSPNAKYVTNPLPLSFSITKDITTTLSPEVVSVGGSTAQDFGYATFSFNIVNTLDFLVAVFIPTTNNFEITSATISVVSNTVTLFSGPLAATTNAIKLKNVPTDYQVTISKTGYANYSATFTTAQIQGFFTIPLVVILNPAALPTGPAVVNLGTAADFGILAGSTITSTGNSIVTGDIGLSPGTTVTGFPPAVLNGLFHFNDAVAVTAQQYLTSALLDAAARTGVVTVATELGGTTLNAGVYNSASGTFGITGILTLDGKGDPNAVFIFQTATTVITAAGSSIVLINGASANNIFWQVGSSATIGTNSIFKGNILAQTSIVLGAGATINGRALAKTGAVTLDTNIITKP